MFMKIICSYCRHKQSLSNMNNPKQSRFLSAGVKFSFSRVYWSEVKTILLDTALSAVRHAYVWVNT